MQQTSIIAVSVLVNLELSTRRLLHLKITVGEAIAEIRRIYSLLNWRMQETQGILKYEVHQKNKLQTRGQCFHIYHQYQ